MTGADAATTDHTPAEGDRRRLRAPELCPATPGAAAAGGEEHEGRATPGAAAAGGEEHEERREG
jgi:hypothetical protein